MIIQVIHVKGVPALKPKRHPPIAGNHYRKMSSKGAFKRVQPKPRKIHTLRSGTEIQCRQNAFKLRHMFRSHLRRAAIFIQRP